MAADRSLHQEFEWRKHYAVSGSRMERLRHAILELYAEQMCSKPGSQRDMAQNLECLIHEAVEVPNE
jgi:hypothetical protein